MSEVQRFWCHDASNIRCVREADFDRVTAERDAQITALKAGNEYAVRKYQELQQRLTAADERGDVLEGLLREAWQYDIGTPLKRKIMAALKPAEGSGDE